MFEFILFMNDRSTAMKMYRTRFANPHGMDMLNHYSSCEDMLILSKESMKYPKLKQIVNTKTYKGLFKFYQEGKVNIKHIIWTNTHKLLGERNIFGIKTGITNKAGGCLSTVFKINEYEQKYGIVIVLGCTSTEARFKDTLKIIKCMEAQSRCSSQSELK